MLLARQRNATASSFTAANFTLRDGRHKVNEGSYLLSRWKKRLRLTKGSALKLLVAHRPQVASGAKF